LDLCFGGGWGVGGAVEGNGVGGRGDYVPHIIEPSSTTCPWPGGLVLGSVRECNGDVSVGEGCCECKLCVCMWVGDRGQLWEK